MLAQAMKQLRPLRMMYSVNAVFRKYSIESIHRTHSRWRRIEWELNNSLNYLGAVGRDASRDVDGERKPKVLAETSSQIITICT